MLDPSIQRSFDQRFAMVRTLTCEALVPREEQLNVSLEDAQRHAFFTFLDETYCVQDLAHYHETDSDFLKATGFVTTELTCVCLENGQTAHFELEKDDTLEVSLTLWPLKFRDLSDEEGLDIDEDDLDQIASDKDVVVYKGEKYYYDDDWAAIYRTGDRDENVFVYEFENETGSSTLTIEEWQGTGREEYRLYLSKPVDAQAFTLISKGD